MNGELAAAILAAEGRRCAAMIANDGAALDAMLDSRLQFHHATGVVDDKAAYLAKVAGGRIRYAGIDWPEKTVLALGADVALLTGRMLTQVQVDGTDKKLDNRVMTVWSRNPQGWQLVAFQSTTIPA